VSAAQPNPVRRIAAIVLAVLLAAGIAVAIVVSTGATKKHLVTISGLSGSEKLPYFQDSRVVKRLHDLGFDVQVEAAGSREIATKRGASWRIASARTVS